MYPVVHLRQSVVRTAHSFQWVRATSIDGDLWGATDVPLSEVSEFYQVTIHQNGSVVRQELVGAATWTYSRANQGCLSDSGRTGVGPIWGRSGNFDFDR